MGQIALPQLPTLKGRRPVILTLILSVGLNQTVVLALFLNKSFGNDIRYAYGLHVRLVTRENKLIISVSEEANRSSACMSSFRSHKSDVWRLELFEVQIIETVYKY